MEEAKDQGGYFTENQLCCVLAVVPNSRWTDRTNVITHLQRFMHDGKIMQEGDRYKWIG